MIEKLSYIKGAPDVREPYYLGDPVDREFGLVVLQPGRPVEAGEMNFMQQATNTTLRKLVSAVVGTVSFLGEINPETTGEDEIRLHSSGSAAYVAVDGIIKTLYAYDQGDDPERGGNRIKLPEWTESGRLDLVYMEMWFEEVQALTSSGDASTTIYEYGMVQDNFILDNDLKIGEIDLTETTRRVQLRAQIKTMPGVTDYQDILALDPKGVAEYEYVQHGGGVPLFRAGDGDNQSGADLNSVDGVVWAVPLVIVERGADASTNESITPQIPHSLNLPDLSLGTEGDLATLAGRVTSVENALGGKASVSHTHTWSHITNPPTTATRWPTWGEVTGKPGTFTPETHVHTAQDISAGRFPTERLPTGTANRFLRANGSGSNPSYEQVRWEDIINKPSGEMSPHTHSADDITTGVLDAARLPSINVSKGGTGRTTLTSGNYLVGNGTGQVILRTPTQVRSDIGAASSSHSHSASEVGAVPTSRTITAGTGLTGGGNLTANRTISVNFGTTSSTVARGNHTHTASQVSGVVTLTGDQTVNGVKRFENYTWHRGGVFTAEVFSGTSDTLKLSAPGGTSDANIYMHTSNIQITAGSKSSRLVSYFRERGLGIGRSPSSNALEVNGNASKSSAGDWLANSDRRIKTNIKPAVGLDKILQINPVTFRYKPEYLETENGKGIEDRVYHNYIAQEVQEVFPEAVSETNDEFEGEKILQLDTHNINVSAVKAIQELHQMVVDLQNEVADLKSKCKC